MLIDSIHDILGLVDVQPTFMPGGELPVAGGHEIVPAVNRLLDRFPRAFATQDWHPADHISFASQHPGRRPYETIPLPYGAQVLWPDHAIAGTANAAIHSGIDQRKIEVVIRKGCHRMLDSYSTFYENDRRTPTGLDGWLRQRGFSRIFLCGLATDFCVAWSAEDAVNHGYQVFVVPDACRGIGLPAGEAGTTMDAARARLTALGVTFIDSDALA